MSELKLAGLDDVFGNDAGMENDGVWKSIPGMDDARIKIRSSDTAKARDKSAKIQRRHAALFRTGQPVPAKESDLDRVEMLATYYVVAWEGFVDAATGQAIPCNRDTVTAVMRKYPRLADLVLQMCDDSANFRAAQTEELAGN